VRGSTRCTSCLRTILRAQRRQHPGSARQACAETLQATRSAAPSALARAACRGWQSLVREYTPYSERSLPAVSRASSAATCAPAALVHAPCVPSVVGGDGRRGHLPVRVQRLDRRAGRRRTRIPHARWRRRKRRCALPVICRVRHPAQRKLRCAGRRTQDAGRGRTLLLQAELNRENLLLHRLEPLARRVAERLHLRSTPHVSRRAHRAMRALHPALDAECQPGEALWSTISISAPCCAVMRSKCASSASHCARDGTKPAPSTGAAPLCSARRPGVSGGPSALRGGARKARRGGTRVRSRVRARGRGRARGPPWRGPPW